MQGLRILVRPYRVSRTSGTDCRSRQWLCWLRRTPCMSRCRPAREPWRRTRSEPEARARRRVLLQEAPLISWSIEMPLDQPGPAVSEPALNVAGKQPTPVSRQPMPRMWASPVATHPVTDAAQDQRCGSRKGSSRLQALLEGELRPSSSGQNADGHDTVGAEEHDQPLLAPLLVGERQARQIEEERAARRADFQITDANSRRLRVRVITVLRFRNWG